MLHVYLLLSTSCVELFLLNMTSFERKDANSQHLPIPPFKYYCSEKFLTFKNASGENYKKAKKLLVNARKKAAKDFEMDFQNCTIYEKLNGIYLENVEKCKGQENGPFIKCNYLEELVIKENLNYLILNVHPSQKFFFFIKNPDMVQYIRNVGCEALDLLDSIDNEEIPSNIIDILQGYPWNVMYDFHIILQIQKFSSEREDTEPVFSSYVLLKPTSEICLALSNKYIADHSSKNDHIIQNEQESKIVFKISRPLYLDTDQTALEVINFLQIYNNPFISKSLKLLINTKWTTVLQEYYSINSRKIHWQEQNDLTSFPVKTSVKDFCEISGTQPFSFDNLKKKLHSILNTSKTKAGDLTTAERPSVFSFDDLKKNLQSFLVAREIGPEVLKNLQRNSLLLSEVFYFELKNDSKSTSEEIEKTYKLSVYSKNGAFYTLLVFNDYVYYPVDSIPLYCVGSKEKLDRYILKVAEIVSNEFSQHILIRYINMFNNEEKSFSNFEDELFDYTMDFDDHSEKCRDQGLYRTWRTVNCDESDSEPFASDEPDNEDVDNVSIHMNGINDNDTVLPMRESIYSKAVHESSNDLSRELFSILSKRSDSPVETQAVNASNGSLSVAFTFEDESVKSLFEAHPFELGECNISSSLKDSGEKRIEIYPSLKSEYKCTLEDFFRDIVSGST